MPIERKPKCPVPRGKKIPQGTDHKVADKESWYTLQNRYGVDAKKIICANFETTVPSGINWYLRTYAGCNKPTSDGKNWTFSSSAKPGIIQIPPKEIVFEEGA